jgi:RNA polymerase sigma-70 factor (ECF subfamily)
MDEESDPLASEAAATSDPIPTLRHELLALQPALLRFARALTRDPDAAEDLAQEALARALRFEDRFTPGTDAKAWLFTITRRLQQKRWRSDRRAPRVVSISDLGDRDQSPADEPVSPLAVEATVMSRFTRDQVMLALQRLPTEQSVPLRLFAGEDMPYRQIAEVLGIPVGTVMSRIFRGRRNLARLLVEEELL